MSASESGSFWLPPQASTVAAEVDSLFDFIVDLNYIFFVLVIAPMVYFVLKYHRKDEAQLATSDVDHNLAIEGAWTFIPLLLCLIVFVWGFRVFLNQRLAPENAYEINVTAYQWGWSFQYETGEVTNDLYVPAGRPVKLIMKSKDVLHSFFVPDFRVKQDVLPNRYTTLWFEAFEPGDHQIYCTEYCGRSHSGMHRRVYVLSDADFNERLNNGFEGAPGGDPVVWGQQLYSQVGCNNCHSLNAGERLIGPSFWGLVGREGRLADGSSYVADEEYIRESIMNPMAKIVEGYPGAMPSFAGQLNASKIDAIIAFMKTLK